MVSSIDFDFNSLLYDINEVDDINNYIDNFVKILDKHMSINLYIKTMHVNFHALRDVLERYSKDVYGLSRIKNELETKINDDLDTVIDNIKNNSGLMVETLEPHYEKRIAYLCYHFSCLRPFSADEPCEKNNIPNSINIDDTMKYFNEFIIYYIMRIIANNLGFHFNFNNKKIKHLLHSLRYRNLSRSSLELLFESLLTKK